MGSKSVRSRCRLLAIWTVLLLTLSAARAQISTGGEDIAYSADGGGSINMQDGLRVTTLRGNVQIQQGRVELFGDIATMEQNPDSGDIVRITVEGAPARFARDGDEGTQRITGHSESITWFTEPGSSAPVTVIRFAGDATFNSGRTALRCAAIRYIPDTGETSSTGPCSGTVAPGEL